MERNVENASLIDARAITLWIPTRGGDQLPVGAVVAGRRLLVLVDEYPLQNWIREHEKEMLQAVVETGCLVSELRIFVDSYK